MLLAIRDRMTGIVAWVICALIIIPFALWGIQDYIGVGNEPAAIKFNEAEMSIREFENRIQINRQQLAQRFDGKIPEFLDNNDLLRQQTANQFINRQALIQYVQDNNYGSSAEEIYASITSLPQFQLDGKFSADTYESQIRAQGYSKPAFEQQVALDIAVRQLQEGLLSSALVTEAQLENYVHLRNQTRDFDYFIVNIASYQKQITLNDAEVETYYNDNKSSFLTEQQISLQYLELKMADVKADIQVDEQTLQDLYDTNAIPGIADKPETRKASHILLLVDETASDAEVAAKQAQIEELRTRALNEDFAALAKEFSEDAGSAPTGGDLGDVSRGVMVKPFEDALFSMQEGDVSDIVKTQFGFHIIKLYKINATQKPLFAEAKNKIEAAYREQEAEKLFFEKADLLANLVFEQSDTLDVAAEELGLKVGKTDLFTENTGVGIAANQIVRSKAFSDELIQEGVNSEAIEIDEGHVVFIRVDEYKPSREKTLAETTQQIKTILTDQKAQDLLQADIETAYSANAEDWVALAKQYNSKLENGKAILRDNRDIDQAIVEQAFLITEPNSSAKVNLVNGDMALVKLLTITDGDFANITNEERQQFQNELLTVNGRTDFENVLTAYKDNAEIIYNPDLNIPTEN